MELKRDLTGAGRFDYCPVEDTISVIGGKWKPLILFHLRDKSVRFNELQRRVGQSSPRMLTLHLRELEKDGVIKRTSYGEIPPRVDYSLTRLGRTLIPVLDAMAHWGIRNGKRRRKARELLAKKTSKE